MEDKKHWYCFCFEDGRVRASVYIGYQEMAVNMARMREAKQNAGVSDGAVVLSVSYLGLMTGEEMLA